MSMSTVIQLPNLDLACIIGFKFKFCNVVLLNYLELYWYLKSTAFSATFVLKSNTFTVLHYFTPAAKHNEIKNIFSQQPQKYTTQSITVVTPLSTTLFQNNRFLEELLSTWTSQKYRVWRFITLNKTAKTERRLLVKTFTKIIQYI